MHRRRSRPPRRRSQRSVPATCARLQRRSRPQRSQVDLHPALLEDARRVPTQRRPHPGQQRGPRLDQVNRRGRMRLGRGRSELHTACPATHHHDRVGLGDPPAQGTGVRSGPQRGGQIEPGNRWPRRPRHRWSPLPLRPGRSGRRRAGSSRHRQPTSDRSAPCRPDLPAEQRRRTRAQFRRRRLPRRVAKEWSVEASTTVTATPARSAARTAWRPAYPPPTTRTPDMDCDCVLLTPKGTPQSPKYSAAPSSHGPHRATRERRPGRPSQG